jgi:cob(I)alamin adenosyltransferase
MTEARSQIHVYTGDGKGKTTACLGLLLRFLGSGGRACLLQFDKGSPEGSDFYAERKALARFEGFTLQATGLPRFNAEKGTFRFKNTPGDLDEARRGLAVARESMAGGYGLLVLDEILSLPLTGLATQADIESLLDHYESLGRPCELVLSGHQIWPELERRVDLITEMKKRKHYFDQALKARKGIEF